MTRYRDIPDHSPEALREACEAAMLCLAFQRLEEEEIAMLRQNIVDHLFAFDLANLELAELPLPIANENSPDCCLFSDGEVFIAATNNDLPTQVFGIGLDGGFTRLAEFPAGQRPDSFAYRTSTDTLYYQLDSSIYAAPRFDVASAQRVALSGGNSGRGLLIGENSYVIVGGNAEVFDFDVQPGAAGLD